jgi:Zn-dependent protease
MSLESLDRAPQDPNAGLGGADAQPPAAPVPAPAPPPDFAAEAANMLSFRLCNAPFSAAGNPLEALLLVPFKLLRIEGNGNSDFPCVRDLSACRVEPATFSDPIRDQLAARVDGHARAGFGMPRFHRLANPLDSAEYWFVTMVDPSGTVLARVTVKGNPALRKIQVFTQFFTLAQGVDGDRVVMTWGRNMELPKPPGWVVGRFPRIGDDALLAQHQRLLPDALGNARTVVVGRDLTVDAAIDRLHGQLVAHGQKVGTLRLLRAGERARFVSLRLAAHGYAPQPMALSPGMAAMAGLPVAAGVPAAPGVPGAEEIAPADREVLVEIARLQNSSESGWLVTLVILGISLVAFVGTSGGMKWDLTYLGLIVAVLFIHETGHYLVMRAFGYRNLKMFFIPFFGAAVSGRNYNISGWKKVLVSLAGPVPGIVLGCVLAVVATMHHWTGLGQFALLLLVINGINLLPVLPLDGGWSVHYLIFSRNPVLEVGFRIVTMIILGLYAISRVRIILGIIVASMAMNTPMTWRVAKITEALRREGIDTASHDDQTIPPAVALAIMRRVRAASTSELSAAQVAQHTISVFEKLNARPPDVPATVLLLGGQVGGFVLAVAFAVVAVVGPDAKNEFHSFLNKLRHMPGLTEEGVSTATIRVLAPAPHDQVPPVTVMTACADATAAAAAGAEALPKLPAGAGCEQFGDALIAWTAGGGKGERDQAEAALTAPDRTVIVADGKMRIMLMMTAQTGAGSAAPAILGDITAVPPALLKDMIMPWDPADARTDDERAAESATRAVVAAIIATARDEERDPGAAEQKLTQEMDEADSAGDAQKLATARTALRKLRQSAYVAAIDDLAKSHPAQADLLAAGRAVTITATNTDEDATDILDPNLDATLAAALRPYVGTVAGRANLAGMADGRSFVINRKLSLFWTPVSAADGAPEMVRWLERQGCTHITFRVMPVQPNGGVPLFTPP